jgi:hypothetical protein rflaF_15811
MVVEASVIVMKCGITKKLSGVRVQKMEDGDWYRTWAFPLKEKTASREGYSQTQIHGSLRKTDDYPGCPHCGSKGFYLCYKCNKVVCWNGIDSNGVCPWCGIVYSSINIVDSFDVNTKSF